MVPPTTSAPDPLQADSARTSALLGGFKGGLRVALKPNTRIVEIRYVSANPTARCQPLSTRWPNTYIEQNFKTKFESTMQASDWLSKQLVDLADEGGDIPGESWFAFRKSTQTPGKPMRNRTSLLKKLAQLNKELTSAEAARMEKESLYRLVQSGDPEVVASTAGALETGGAVSGPAVLRR